MKKEALAGRPEGTYNDERKRKRYHTEYTYDGDGWRAEKRIYNTGVDSERVRYIYYGNDLIAEVKVTVNSNGTVASSTLSRGYHWMSGGAGEAWRLLSVQDYERGAVALPGYDGRGNIVTWTNGANGELIGTADYGPYGERFDIWWKTEADEESYERFGFGTEYRDETGLIYYGARYYNPSLGRFISRDPAGEAGSGVNLYAFCGGDPVNRRELYGLCYDGGGFMGALASAYNWLCGKANDFGNWLGGLLSGGSSDQPVQPDSNTNSSGGTNSGGYSGGGGGRSDGGSATSNESPAHVPSYWDYKYSKLDIFDKIRLQGARIEFYDNSDYDEYVNYIQPILDYNRKLAPNKSIYKSIDGNSSLGDFVRDHVPLFGGILGGVGDVVSGIGNVAAGILTFGQSGTLGRGLGQIGYGIGSELNIFGSDALAAVAGIMGTAVTTLTDVYNVATLGTQTLPDRSNSPSGPTEFLGAIQRLVFDALIPDYGFMGGANWGTTQFGTKGPYLNWVDYSSQIHDNDGMDRNWVKRGWSTNHEGRVAPGPVGIAYVLAGTIPFWLNNGQGYGTK